MARFLSDKNREYTAIGTKIVGTSEKESFPTTPDMWGEWLALLSLSVFGTKERPQSAQSCNPFQVNSQPLHFNH